MELQVAVVTGIFTLLGAGVTGAFSVWVYRLSEKEKKKKENLAFYKELIGILKRILDATVTQDFDAYYAGVGEIDQMFVELSVFAPVKIWDAVIAFLNEAKAVKQLPESVERMEKVRQIRQTREKIHEILRLIRCEVGLEKMK